MNRVRLTVTAALALTTLAALVQCGGSSPSAGAACTALSSCCTSSAFPAGSRLECATLAASEDQAACQSSLTAFTSSAYCTAAAPPSPAAACATLAPCCASPAYPATAASACLSVASSGDGSACQAQLSVAQAGGYCGAVLQADGGAPRDSGLGHDSTLTSGSGSGGGPDATASGPCAQLATCCTSPTVPANQVAQCLTDVSSGDPSSCANALQAFQSEGACGGLTGSGTGSSGSGSGGGTCVAFCSTDTDCAVTCAPQAGISQCCDTVSHACYTSSAQCPVPVSGDAGGDGAIY